MAQRRHICQFSVSCVIFMFAAILMPARADDSGRQTDSASHFLRYKQGFNSRIWLSNAGVMGKFVTTGTPDSGIGLEYPLQSNVEHLFGAGMWIGAIIDTGTDRNPKRIKTVTTGFEGWSGPLQEMFGHPDGRDSFFVTSINTPNRHNARMIDDDGDGKKDEDELDGVDNDNDGLIDEDYGAVSEKDVYVAYYDIYGNPNPIPNHVPLGIKIWQRSFAWDGRMQAPILPFEFYVVNVGNKILDSVVLGFYADPDVGPVDTFRYWSHNTRGYLHQGGAFVSDPWDASSTPVGVICLAGPRPLDSLRYKGWIYQGYNSPSPDRIRYGAMSEGMISIEDPPYIGDYRVLISFGFFRDFKPGDTLRCVFAFVNGDAVGEGENSLASNAERAYRLYRRNFFPPYVPPPPLHITQGVTRVELDWRWRPGDPAIDPLESWDDFDSFLDVLPDTHWRRRNPPLGHTRGGRNLEGFCLYRSESPTFNVGQFVPLMRWDMNDDLSIGNQTGLHFSYVDSNLTPGKTYWYAVTSFSIPEMEIVRIPDSNGVYHDSIQVYQSFESRIKESAKLVVLAKSYRLYDPYPNPFNPSTKIVFDVPVKDNVSIRVYDVLGREVTRLVDEFKFPGRYESTWNAAGFASGVYFCQLRAGTFVDTKKVVLLR